MAALSTPHPLYRPSLALLTDLYQLTMAQGYWAQGMHEQQVVFHLTFRRCPFAGQYALAAGLPAAVELLDGLRFDEADLAYLAGLTGRDGASLFQSGFLSYLRGMQWRLTVHGVPEGTAVFPHEPLLRVEGPLLQAQLVETPLLTLMNFSTLIATKASRVVAAAAGDPVLEFGLRRAQGVDGGLTASRAAYIGGCLGTSDVLAGRLHDLPVRGTHAHSWVMAFDSELEAFNAYAEVMPNNCIFLVDTYDTLQGVRNAITVGRVLRERGHELLGVRLDSGDLVALSVAARRMLDEAGFPNAAVVASNDLDEHRILALKAAGARVGVWGVGTRLVTAQDQPALGGVYKLAAVRGDDGVWRDRVKLSEDPIKVSNPGMQQVLRERRDGRAVRDVLVDARDPRPDGMEEAEELLVPVLREGEVVAELDDVHAARARGLRERASLPDAVTRWDDPEPYPMELSAPLLARKQALIKGARGPRNGESR